MELTTHQGRQTFVVNGIEILDPNDVSVLRSRGGVSLTLVTCYPFYFVGHAPMRYIVTAVLDSAYEASTSPTKTQFPRASITKIRRGTDDLN